jgi:hypothetical protein
MAATRNLIAVEGQPAEIASAGRLSPQVGRIFTDSQISGQDVGQELPVGLSRIVDFAAGGDDRPNSRGFRRSE